MSSADRHVLLVSPYPYTQTGRGMDVLTGVFEDQDWTTTHLTFPRVFYTNRKRRSFPTTVQELKARVALIPYIDSLMFWLPKPLFRLYCSYASSKARFVKWTDYDYIVLESGKPLFLLDSIPRSVKIIYRQSDSVKLVLGKGRWYRDLEDRACRRADRIITVKDVYKESLPDGTKEKALTILNGFSIPGHPGELSPYRTQKKNVVYVGLTPLDPPTLHLLCRDHPDVDFHIFGSCLKSWEQRSLSKHTNFHFYGFRPREDYLPYLAHADAAIFPFKYFPGMDHVGFTTKYLNFMYFSLPVVSYLTGERREFEPYSFYLPEDAKGFSRDLLSALKGGPVKYAVDFDFYSHQGRRKEYVDFIGSLSRSD